MPGDANAGDKAKRAKSKACDKGSLKFHSKGQVYTGRSLIFQTECILADNYELHLGPLMSLHWSDLNVRAQGKQAQRNGLKKSFLLP